MIACRRLRIWLRSAVDRINACFWLPGIVRLNPVAWKRLIMKVQVKIETPGHHHFPFVSAPGYD